MEMTFWNFYFCSQYSDKPSACMFSHFKTKTWTLNLFSVMYLKANKREIRK